MNEFVNPHHRGVNLPEGFKDLADVLEAKRPLAAETPIYALHSKRPPPEFVRHTQGLSHVERFLNLILNSKSGGSFLIILLEDAHSLGLRPFRKNLIAHVAFREGELILEKTLTDIFAAAGLIPVSLALSHGKGRRGYQFEIPIGGTRALEIAMEILRAYGVSENDELSFLFRA